MASFPVAVASAASHAFFRLGTLGGQGANNQFFFALCITFCLKMVYKLIKKKLLCFAANTCYEQIASRLGTQVALFCTCYL